MKNSTPPGFFAEPLQDAASRAVFGGTVWQGRAAMRISVSNWSTTEEDVQRSIDAIVRASGQGD
jgi:hypothetical protein